MKKSLFVAILIFANFAFAAGKRMSESSGESHHGPVGLGVAIGSPFALTAEYWLNNKRSIDAGFGFGWGPWSLIYADYHWNFPQVFGHNSDFVRQLIGYVGVGGGLGFWRDNSACGRFSCGNSTSGTAVILRVPVGLEWFPHHPPFGLFAEITPDFAITPGFGGSIDIQIGGRYYF